MSPATRPAASPAEIARPPDTKERLLTGALETVRTHGIAGVSARTVAAAAGVNQALVFYHFGTLDDLLSAACHRATTDRVAAFQDRLDAVTSLRGLLDLGRTLHAEERELGNVQVLAQLLAGAQQDRRLAEPVASALRLWTNQIEGVLRRVLADSPLGELTDPAGLASAVSSAFIGLELYEGVDSAAAQAALAALEQLGVLAELVDGLGPVARRAVRVGTRRLRTRPAGHSPTP
jgi:AcrR family transcriptional regulator